MKKVLVTIATALMLVAVLAPSAGAGSKWTQKPWGSPATQNGWKVTPISAAREGEYVKVIITVKRVGKQPAGFTERPGAYARSGEVVDGYIVPGAEALGYPRLARGYSKTGALYFDGSADITTLAWLKTSFIDGPAFAWKVPKV